MAKQTKINQEEEVEYGFGLTEEGWDKDDLSDILSLLAGFAKIRYELETCRRGAYAVSGDTIQDLKNDLIELNENLESVIGDLPEIE